MARSSWSRGSAMFTTEPSSTTMSCAVLMTTSGVQRPWPRAVPAYWLRHAGPVPHPVRQRILITGASAGLGEGMARRFAAMGRDLALVARRLDRLEALQRQLLAARPGIRVEVSAMDVDDADSVATVLPALAERLCGAGRVIANAGIGRGGSID